MRILLAFRRIGLAFAISAISVSTVSAQQTGVITGRITDTATGAPIVGAQVMIAQTTLGALTNSNGVYTIRRVMVGPALVRALSIGYAEQSRAINVGAGTTTADFALRQVPIDIAPVVATPTGETRRQELGNSVGAVNAAKRNEETAISNIADMITAQVPGVMVVPGVQTGAGVRVRIRGTSSLSLSNNPIWIVDGIRIEGTTGSSSISVGGSTVSRIGDINPEEIESIEIVRGPSAATLYGTDAANGVVVITTKKGRAGPSRWTYYTEQTAITDRNTYPTAYRAWRTGTTSTTNSTAANTVQCFITQAATGLCAQDSVTRYNLHDDPESTPYGTGYRQQHGLQVSGGSETFKYFLHGEWENEDGVTQVPEFERRYLASRGLTLRPEMEDPNALGRVTGRVNIAVAPRDNLDINVNTGYITEDIRLSRSDDSGTAGIAANTFGGPGFKYNLNAAGDTLYGWREFTPRDVYETVTNQAIERLVSSVSTNWRPRDWFTVRGSFGIDFTSRNETQICRFGDCTSTSDRLGFKIDNRTNFYLYTVDAGATASHRFSNTVASQTAIGLQYYQNIFTRNGAQGTTLTPGAVTVNAGAVKAADETTSDTRTLGAYIEERVALRDRLYLTGAVRSDRNSAFGADFKTAFYPKLSASWIVSEEPFFPKIGSLSQLRLRTAYGASGVQPGPTDAVPFYSATRTLGESGEVPGAVFTALGNSNLKPERSAELEMGFDAAFWNDRINTELTYYNKKSKDALVERVLPPSLGTGSTVRFENLGEVRNTGWEGRISARLVSSDAFGWSMELNGSRNDNKLVTLGLDTIPAIVVSSTLRHVEGYPLNGWWSRRLVSFEDRNKNGIIDFSADSALSEIVVSPDVQYHGRSAPNLEMAFTNGFDFFARRLRLSALIDYKGGHLVYNNTERIRCASRFNCAGLLDPKSSLYEQARTVMVREHASRSVAGFFEPGDFIRMRELALTFSPDQAWTQRLLRTRNIVATLAIRNLGMLWTKYTGVDAESFGTTGDAPSSFQAFGPPTYYTLRLTLGI